MNLKPMKQPHTNHWQAVLSRDKTQDDAFVYAVKSTGIYCLPSCASRKPKVENVEFFRLPELAKRSGYRACKRCKPDDKDNVDKQITLIRAICRYIETHFDESLTLELLSQEFKLSSSQLQRSFKRLVGISPQAYLEAYRISSIKTALQDGEDISAALYDAGYGSSSRLYSKANTHLGMTPKTYKEKGASVLIHYSISSSPLGKLLVAATEKGICSVRLGSESEVLLTELENEFSKADVKEDKLALAPWVKQIVAHLEGKEPHLDLALDVRATAFQKQVWLELQKIPYGETRSYSDVATAMGKPKAVRAVASACARNPVALVVPCHRVIRTDGSMGGFRWGIERKESLLAQEAKLSH